MAKPEASKSNNSPENQELFARIRENERELLQLRKRLADYSIKEAQIRHENDDLQKRIADIHVAFDHQQHNLENSESKSSSYRQQIIEENIHLAYALENAEQERLTFMSTLLPLLAQYSLQPPDPDARSVVSNLKVLFRHLQEQLIRNENQERMGVVPQSVSDRDISGGHQSHLVGLDGAANKVEADESGRQITSENSFYGVAPKTGDTTREPESNNIGVNDHDGDANRNERETSSNRSSDIDDGPLPALVDLQIFGEPFPGKELLACGYCINGTSICNFEWIRHFEDGSVNIIDGAMRPNYLVTADDVDTYLAVQVLPLDDRNRKGEPVTVYANDKKKITCDSEMQSYVERTLHSGRASYEVSLPTGYLDIWEPATLTIKRHGYSIKCRGPSGDVFSEKFSPSVRVVIPHGHVLEFVMICSSGVELLLRTENNSTDASGSRDTIVLVLRNFIQKVMDIKERLC
ncbi:uncharacterized protein LOC114729251 isoform X2 [Neltuma alba]|uniref:uncharacterized protein LOC114715765 isoform X2 n=1 Tax=Neltuma alba TaxID=207710 RepID=UPI0010A526A8|nr:uncharacterized protein LOC114715765 isoform X2 [Prosopis alba]XP_028772083.1 uncharacterized protein LOC114729251 isoform X2 [Prosopis alba]